MQEIQSSWYDMKSKENPPAKPSTEEPPNLELIHLKNAFLGDNNTLAVIIVANLI